MGGVHVIIVCQSNFESCDAEKMLEWHPEVTVQSHVPGRLSVWSSSSAYMYVFQAAI